VENYIFKFRSLSSSSSTARESTNDGYDNKGICRSELRSRKILKVEQTYRRDQ